MPDLDLIKQAKQVARLSDTCSISGKTGGADLAERQAAPLATLDATLTQAAQRENISLVGHDPPCAGLNPLPQHGDGGCLRSAAAGG